MRSAYSLNNDKARTKTSILSELEFDLRGYSNEHNSSTAKYASASLFLYFNFVFTIAKEKKKKIESTGTISSSMRTVKKRLQMRDFEIEELFIH